MASKQKKSSRCIGPRTTIFFLVSLLATFVAVVTVHNALAAARRAAHTLPADVFLIRDNGSATGSGVHIGGGLILTAAHVVASEATIGVEDRSGAHEEGEVLWANKFYDIALIKIPDASRLRTAPLRCHPALHVGDLIHAVGNPLDAKFVTMWGRVGATSSQHGPWFDVFVGDITVVPGMSGGPVYNRYGELIGITVGMGALPMMGGGVINPFAFAYIVPTDAVCTLLGRATGG